MKEININIEGYNVNGICVGCLNYNRKMYSHKDVNECFKLLGNIDVPDGLTIQVCWECMAVVRTVRKFQMQMLKSYDILIDYSKWHTFMNSPEDFTVHATTHFVYTDLEPCIIPYVEDIEVKTSNEIEIKEETEPKYQNFEVEQVKDEPNLYEYEMEYPDELHSQDLDHNVSSDEDVQLSKLKRKKEKKERKKEKKKKGDKVRKIDKDLEEVNQRFSRKLKNLPSDIVELVTMEEEEMWRIRSEDVNSNEFHKLKYKCENCIIGFNTEKLMTDHFNGKHRPKSDNCHQCDVCKAYFLTKDNLSVHRSLHLAAYKCRACGVLTTLKRHMLKHDCVRIGADEQYKCQTCHRVFNTKSKLSYHRGVCHHEKPQCDCCGKVFANKMTLKYHLKILPQNKEGKPKEKLFLPCKGCDKIFHSKKSYRAHAVIHDGLTYPCPICGKLFMWKRNLSRHTRNHRERDAGARHSCRECGKTFSSRDCYNNHMRLSKRHVAEATYAHECNYCGKKFPTKWCMVDHIDWDHLKRIKYQCSVCFKAFKTAKIMVAHMNNIHEGKKREAEGEHLCEICGKSYKTVKRLKGHVWAMHTKRSTTKSFKCKLCSATFTWQTSIYKHMKMMHKAMS